jgi:hypothetical protein
LIEQVFFTFSSRLVDFFRLRRFLAPLARLIPLLFVVLCFHLVFSASAGHRITSPPKSIERDAGLNFPHKYPMDGYRTIRHIFSQDFGFRCIASVRFSSKIWF